MPLSGKRLDRAVRYNKSRGYSRTQIKGFQSKLGVGSDGVIGPRTTQAVFAFQSRHGSLTNDGMLGSGTAQHLQSSGGGGGGDAGGGGGGGGAGGGGAGGGDGALSGGQVQSALRFNRRTGFSRTKIKAIQTEVGSDPDGSWGPDTCKKIARWQAGEGLEADGKCGAKTMGALNLPKESPQQGGGGGDPQNVPQGNITSNFSWGEFKSKGDGVAVPASLRASVTEVCQNLEVLRTACGGCTITVNSGYRSPWWNEQVGGKSNSFHKRGMAADIRVAGLTPKKTKSKILTLIGQGKMKQGGIGLYNSFVHYDVRGSAARW